MVMKCKCLEFRKVEAKAKADVCTCYANLYTVTPCLHRAHGVCASMKEYAADCAVA